MGNSSCGIHEAPYYGVPMVNVGSYGQNNRALTNDIIDVPDNKEAILAGIKEASQLELEPISLNGKGESAKLFLDVISNSDFWGNSTQKSFVDLSPCSLSPLGEHHANKQDRHSTGWLSCGNSSPRWLQTTTG